MPTYREWLRLAVLGVAPALMAACRAGAEGDGARDATADGAALPVDAALDTTAVDSAPPDAGADGPAYPDGWPTPGDAGGFDAHWLEGGRGPIVCADASAHAGTLFLPPAVHDAGGGGGVAVADFNGDGKPDVVVSYGSTPYLGRPRQGPAVLLGLADGGFQAAPQPDGGKLHIGNVATADFNGDGRTDVLGWGLFDCVSKTGCGGRAGDVFLGDGTGVLGEATPAVFPYGGPAIVDLNGDGYPDLAFVGYQEVFANLSPWVVQTFLDRGDASFAPSFSRKYTASFTTDPLAADMNGDGRPDLIFGTSSQDAYSVIVLLGAGDGTFSRSLIYPVDGSPVAVADFNADGLPDVALESEKGLSVLLGAPDGILQPPQMTYALQPSNEGAWLHVADLNGDGYPDVIFYDGQSASTLLLGVGDGTFTQSTASRRYAYPYTPVIADMNGDGLPDLVAGTSDGLTIALNAGCR